jgi:uncharacterized lipoprotein YddW (UPF0748 family)
MKIQTLLACLSLSVFAQAQTPPKREFRAAWIATVNNIDYPSNKNLSVDSQKVEFTKLLDRHKEAGLNAVIVQIRSNGDALYPSDTEPWAEQLTGLQGRAPAPFYDPLAFMIQEARKRGLEFHAWFNPYRAVPNVNTAILAQNHVAIRRPDLLLPFGNLRILNPGLPEVRTYITQVVMEVVRRYDIDAVHFDDYFYPYPSAGVVLNDTATFTQHNRSFTNLADWRRDNVDLLIKMVSDSIKATKAWVKFGISPFGIWQNRSASQPNGSATSGLESYNTLYADSRKWLQQNWVDYMLPQLYWYIGQTAANYQILTNWWAALATTRHLYIGQAAYKVGTETNWSATQVPDQMRLNRQTANVWGSSFYNSKAFNANPLGMRDSLRLDFYKYPALLPLMSWKDNTPPPAPTNVLVALTNTTASLKWARALVTANELDKTRQYAVYRADDYTALNINDVRQLRAIVTDTFFTEAVVAGRRYVYVVTALDRFHNESPPSVQAVIIGTSTRDTEGGGDVLFYQNLPNPFSEKTILRYELAKEGPVHLGIYDIAGRELSVLVQQFQPIGKYEVVFEKTDLQAGVYLAVLKYGTTQRVIKIVKQ